VRKITYQIGRLSEEEQLRFDFADGLSRTVYERVQLGFVLMKLPVIDEAPYRIFGTMMEYRKWANENIPTWLGYHSEDDR
jgi:hypothetical protein